MKPFKNPGRTKWIAALLIVLIGIASICSIFTTCFTYEMGLYQYPLKRVLSDKYSNLQEYYSVKIYKNRTNAEKLPDITNMEYGILHSDKEQPDFTNLKEYIYTNFSDTKPLDTSTRYRFVSDGNYRAGDSTLLSSLLNYTYYSSHPNDTIYKSERISRVVFNKDNGVFYLMTETHCLPLIHIKVYNTNVARQTGKSDRDLNTYEKFTLSNYSNISGKKDAKQKGQSIENTNTYLSDSGICAPLYTSNYKKWIAFYIGSRKCYTESIDTVTSSDLYSIIYDKYLEILEPDNLPLGDEEMLQALNANYPYVSYTYKAANSGENYWIVSNVKTAIDTTSNDLFAKQTKLLTFLHKYRILFIVLSILFSIGFVLSLIMLGCSIKATQKPAESHVSILYKLPLILVLGTLGAGGASFLYVSAHHLSETIHGNIGGRLGLLSSTIFLAIGAILWVFLLMNLLTRYYKGIFWKYTILSHIVMGIRKLWRLFLENTSLFLKGILVYMIFLIGEFILICDYPFDESMFLLGIVTLITAPIYFIILLQLKRLQKASRHLAEGNLTEKVNTRKLFWEFKKHGEYLNQLSDGMSIALEERLRSERFRTELITNVSHDIKTPLTSIINYIDLLQKENITEADRTEYLNVLNRQSARLKKLIEDLMEASKASTGNLPTNPEPCDIDILLTQTTGEFQEKLWAGNLELIVQKPAVPIIIQADSRHLWRIFDNLMNNICKYAQPGTRVYINQETTPEHVHIIFLNISKSALNISGDELMERFVRGDSSRNTEGSGLGLSIARSLAELMGGTLKLHIEGDLFKVILTFPNEARSSSGKLSD